MILEQSIRTLQVCQKLKRQLKKDLISGAICQHQGLLNATILTLIRAAI